MYKSKIKFHTSLRREFYCIFFIDFYTSGSYDIKLIAFFYLDLSPDLIFNWVRVDFKPQFDFVLTYA